MKLKSSYKKVRLILGDQLNRDHTWYQKQDADCLYILMEMHQETNYVKHHIQKIVAFFLSMEAMGQWLSESNHDVLYLKLDDPKNTGNLVENLEGIVKDFGVSQIEYQLPDEYRLDEQMKGLESELGIPCLALDTEHFLTERDELARFFEGKKTLLMESFYRYMRKKYNLLMDPMDDSQPLTGKWNYDHENRGSIKAKHEIEAPFLYKKDVESLISRIDNQGVSYIGNIETDDFIWPTTPDESRELLSFFLTSCLPVFGKYQDAMVERSWSVYHARISFSMNSKMLHPLEVVKSAIAHWEDNQDEITIAQVEGFVRQIIGWREYMRGVYWKEMPDYAELNYFDHQRKLPDYYWSGETKMNCMQKSIQQSLDYAYAHHIQRLMVTGNFALLTGINPDELDQWYLGIYIDAIEWVEITNTRGMSQFADGGIVGTKPYISSANYINKMSDYCKGCYYDKSVKVGEKACPFNSLYWNFYEVNRPLLGKNPRVGMMYRVWDRNSEDQKKKILEQAEYYLDNIEEL